VELLTLPEHPKVRQVTQLADGKLAANTAIGRELKSIPGDIEVSRYE
jgi:hypothetical protein